MAVHEIYHPAMRSLRCIFIMACFAVMAPAILAAEKTTAVWSDGHTSSVSDEELIQYAVASPGAAYPEEAQKAKTAGSGLYELRINKVGATTEVVIVRSSGSAVLDKAARTAFKRWRFKPGVFTSIRIPVSWSVNRVR
jgi:TonB family protein